MKERSQVKLSKVMTKDVMTVSPQDTVSKVSEIFRMYPFHHLPVTDSATLVGMVSSSDLERISHGMTLFRDLNKKLHDETLFRSLRVVDIMVRDLFTLKSDDSLVKAYETFERGRFRAIPVTHQGELVGIVTPLDLTRYLLSGLD